MYASSTSWDPHQLPTTSFSETTWTADANPWNASSCFSPTKSNTPRTSFFCAETTNAPTSTERMYDFYDECNRRFSVQLWKRFQSVFDMMPLAGLISGRIVCMHGGISPELEKLSQIRDIPRPLPFNVFTRNGLPCDLLWADPDYTNNGWNTSIRGISHNFGPDVLQDVCRRLDLDLVARAHQVVLSKTDSNSSPKNDSSPFSAPNYCNEFNNMGAIMVVRKNIECKFQALNLTNKAPNPKPLPTGSQASDP